MAKIKKNDFVELEYTGIIKDGNLIFDTTDKTVAKDNEIDNPQMEYGPIIVCIGKEQLLKGLEEELIGKETGQEFTIELDPEKGFGKKDAKLIKMIPYRAFKKQNIEPQPGMQVNIDGLMGIVKTAAGGRCLVDFNHPLSGKELIYNVKVNKILTDDAVKIESYLKLGYNIKTDVNVKEEAAEIKTKSEIPKDIQEKIEKDIKEVIPSVRKLSFSVEKEEKTKKLKEESLKDKPAEIKKPEVKETVSEK